MDIQFTVNLGLTPSELARNIVNSEEGINEDTIFELIKCLELELADEEFCKKLADYFTAEYNKCMMER